MTLQLKTRWLPCSKCQPTVYSRGLGKFLAHKKKNIHRILRNRCQAINRTHEKPEDRPSCHGSHKRLSPKVKVHLKVQVHRGIVHQKQNNKSWQCSSCSKKFLGQAQLSWHLIMAHAKEARFECTKCPRKFFSKAAGRKHLREKHGI